MSHHKKSEHLVKQLPMAISLKEESEIYEKDLLQVGGNTISGEEQEQEQFIEQEQEQDQFIEQEEEKYSRSGEEEEEEAEEEQEQAEEQEEEEEAEEEQDQDDWGLDDFEIDSDDDLEEKVASMEVRAQTFNIAITNNELVQKELTSNLQKLLKSTFDAGDHHQSQVIKDKYYGAAESVINQVRAEDTVKLPMNLVPVIATLDYLDYNLMDRLQSGLPTPAFLPNDKPEGISTSLDIDSLDPTHCPSKCYQVQYPQAIATEFSKTGTEQEHTYFSMYGVPTNKFKMNLVFDSVSQQKAKKRQLRGGYHSKTAHLKMATAADAVTGIKCSLAENGATVRLVGFFRFPYSMIGESPLKRHMYMIKKLKESRRKHFISLTSAETRLTYRQIVANKQLSYTTLASMLSDKLVFSSISKIKELVQKFGIQQPLSNDDLSLFKTPNPTSLEEVQNYRNRLTNLYQEINDLLMPIYKTQGITDQDWIEMSPEQRQIRLGLLIDAKDTEFYETVIASYGNIYPYSYSKIDSRQTQIAWLDNQPDNGKLFFMKLQQMSVDQSHEPPSPPSPPDVESNLITQTFSSAGKRPYLWVYEGKLYVYYDQIKPTTYRYLKAELYKELIQYQRLDVLYKTSLTYKRQLDGLAKNLEQATYKLKAAIFNSTVIRGIDSLTPVEGYSDSKLLNFLKSLNLEDGTDISTYLTVVKNDPRIELDSNFQYHELSTDNWICCEHHIRFLELGDMSAVEAEFLAADKVSCRYCSAILDSKADEFFGVSRDGHLNVHRTEQETEDDTIGIDNSDMFMHSIVAIVNIVAALKLDYTDIKYISDEVYKLLPYTISNTRERFGYLLNDEAKLQTGKALNDTLSETVKNHSKIYKLLVKNKILKDAKDSNFLAQDLVYKIIYLNNLLQRIGVALASTVIRLQTVYFNTRDGNTIITVAANKFNYETLASIATEAESINFNNELLKEAFIASIEGQDIASLIMDSALEYYTKLKPNYLKQFAELEKHKEQAGVVEDERFGLSNLNKQVISIKLGDLSGYINSDNTIVRRSALLAQTHQTLSSYDDLLTSLAAKVPELPTVQVDLDSTGEVSVVERSAYEYDLFSKVRLTRDGKDCFKAPSLLLYGMLSSGATLQNWYMHTDRADIESTEVFDPYQNHQDERMAKYKIQDYQSFRGDALLVDTLSRPNFVKALNPSDRVYHIFFTRILPVNELTYNKPKTIVQSKSKEYSLETLEYVFDNYLSLNDRCDNIISEAGLVDLLITIEKYQSTKPERITELAKVERDNLHKYGMITAHKDDLVFSEMENIENIAKVVGLDIASPKKKIPAKQLDIPTISGQCDDHEASIRLQTLYQTISIVFASINNGGTIDEDGIEKGKLIESIEAIEAIDGAASNLEYALMFKSLADLPISVIRKFLETKEDTELLPFDIYCLAVKMEIALHLIRSFNTQTNTIPPESIEMFKDQLDSAQSTGFNLGIVGIFNVITEHLKLQDEVRDPLNKTYYDNVLQREFKTFQGFLNNRTDWQLHQMGLKLGDLTETTEANEQGNEVGESVEIVPVAVDDDEIYEMDDANDGNIETGEDHD